ALAPDLLARQDLLGIALLLLVSPVGDDGGTRHADAEDVEDRRRLLERHLLVEDQLLHKREALSARVAWPREPDEPRAVELPLPGPQERVAFGARHVRRGSDALVPVGRNIRLQPRADLLAE